MQFYEYKVVPAPTRAEKIKGLKKSDERFAHALSGLMNAMAAEGWEYQRADILPCTERKGLTGTATVYHNLLVFRRALAPAEQPATAEAPTAPDIAAPVAPPAAPPLTGPAVGAATAPEAEPLPAPTPPVRLANWSPRRDRTPEGDAARADSAAPVLRAARQEPPASGRPVVLDDAGAAPRLRWPLRSVGEDDGGKSS